MEAEDQRRMTLEIAALLEYAHRYTPEQAHAAATRAVQAIGQEIPTLPNQPERLRELN